MYNSHIASLDKFVGHKTTQILYHGSNQVFDHFKGREVYATSDIEFAKTYGDHIAIIEKDLFFEPISGHPIESPTFVSYYPKFVKIIKWI